MHCFLCTLNETEIQLLISIWFMSALQFHKPCLNASFYAKQGSFVCICWDRNNSSLYPFISSSSDEVSFILQSLHRKKSLGDIWLLVTQLPLLLTRDHKSKIWHMWDITYWKALFLVDLRHFNSFLIIHRVAVRCAVYAGIYFFTHLLFFVIPIFILLYLEHQKFGHVSKHAG